ncbi:ribbon-helix-helix protein, CopG family [Candidatus Bathyarchaeota archaeon]|nr:ribbon-helix-helix protein, CopG family [Candidatus Bathyarchaeota archaeon]
MSRLKKWSIPVTEQLDKAVEKAIQKDSHVSKSDFIRDAVREKLRNLGLLDGERA